MAEGTEQREVAQRKALCEAIRAVVRGDAGKDAVRRDLIAQAETLKLSGLVPDNWAADGSLVEKRETANDVFAALEGALEDAYDETSDCYWYMWVLDWDGAEDSYRVIYCRDDDIWAAPFSWDGDGKVVVDVESATKVRPITLYVDRSKQRNRALPPRPRSVDSELRAVRDGMRGEREIRQMPSGPEMREVARDDGEGSWVVCAGYFSLSCADMQDDSNAYEMEDAYGPWVESTVRGFAAKTIREACDTAFLVNHQGVTMARTKAGTLDLDERLDGGHYEGRLNPTRPDVQIIRAAVQDKAVDESSFAFRVVRQKWSDDYTRRWIQEIDLNKGDVSPVNYGANPHTGGHLSMRSAVAVLASRVGLTERTWAAALKEIRAGRTLSQATVDTLEPIHEYLTQGSDQAASLADLLDLDADAAESDDQERSASVYLLPDFTSRAALDVAQMRRR